MQSQIAVLSVAWFISAPRLALPCCLTPAMVSATHLTCVARSTCVLPVLLEAVES